MFRVVCSLLLYVFSCIIFVALAGWLVYAVGLGDPILASFAGITLATWIMVRFFDHGRLPELGLIWCPGRLRELALGLALPFFLMAGILFTEWVAGWLLITGLRPQPAALLYNLRVFAMVAWYEELSVRGYLFRTLRRALPIWAAQAFSAFFFAGLHAMNPGATLPALFGVFLAGLLLGLACHATDGLYLPMAFHFSWNFFQAFFGFPVSGQPFPGLFSLVREGPTLITGGPFGPEAGLLGFTAVLAAGGVIFSYVRRDGHARRPDPSPL
ncbi:MAG: CPBP family intramembrane metalloprotease [Firmicutes bacterium]|nr:CPBP family intramembrane metalloprotease [Bacillota bacterium]